MLTGAVDADIDAFEVSDGMGVGRRRRSCSGGQGKRAAVLGRNCRVEAGAELRELTVVGDNAVVKQGAFLHRAVTHGNCLISPQAVLRGCVVGSNTVVLRGGRIEEGAVVGNSCVVEEDAYISAGVKVYPSTAIEAGAQISDSVIWERRGSRAVFFFDGNGADISPSTQRAIERALPRREFHRARAAEIGELSFPPHSFEAYTTQLLAQLDVSGVRGAALKVVVDASGGATSFVLPSLLGRLGVDALTVHLGAEEAGTTETQAQRTTSLRRLGELVVSAQAAVGVPFDHVGERMRIIDDRGRPVGDEPAMLIMIDLIGAEHGKGAVAVPFNTSRIAEDVARIHGVGVRWTGIDAFTMPQSDDDLIFGSDGRGGFVLPEVGPTVDAIAGFVRLVGLLARTNMPLSRIDARIPEAHVLRRSVRVPSAAKGTVMRAVNASAAGFEQNTTDGIRVLFDDHTWVLIRPDQSDALIHVWAEGVDERSSAGLVDSWSALVTEAAR